MHIPKGKRTEIRQSVPTFEDKTLQCTVVMVIGEVYEQDSYFAYGFRSGRFAHQALEGCQKAAWRIQGKIDRSRDLQLRVAAGAE